ncbi:MAG: class I SAM-dependent methyltransferase [Gemmatimonadales bacterium]|jgi:ubiquinone/menaquinone biosynthesis C-methylase UbiE
MGLYSKYVLPKVTHLTCRTKPLMKQREKVIPLARGRVLEIGIGSGLNLQYYDAENVKKCWGLDPAPEMLKLAEGATRSVPFDVEFLAVPADEIPLENGSVDTVVVTYTLCTIPETQPALKEMARVLDPRGQLIFCEHGAAPDASVRRWQDLMNPLWRRFGGGCQLNRLVPELIEQGGFRIERMETMYIPGWRPASFNYWGTAVLG